MIGYDLDGVLTGDEELSGCVVISGRTFAEYDQTCRRLAQRVPVYIRGSGRFGDRTAAADFKAVMIAHLGVKVFFEDDPVQAEWIRRLCPTVQVLPPTRRPA